MEKSNSAKFAFLYAISLVALIITAVATGAIVFQVINKFITETGSLYSGIYSLSSLRMALASLLIAAPTYFLSTVKINKSLYRGDLLNDSGVRKWLSYLILFITSVVMIGYFIGIFYSFLEGEVTTKFALKALTVIAISAIIFSYYFYDVSRRAAEEVSKKIKKIYFWTSIVLVAAVFVTGIMLMESPAVSRQKRQDNEALNSVMQVDSAVNYFYAEQGRLPQNLAELVEKVDYLDESGTLNPITDEEFGYRVVSAAERRFELCVEFQLSNKDDNDDRYYYAPVEWKHDAGEQCFTRTVTDAEALKRIPAGF